MQGVCPECRSDAELRETVTGRLVCPTCQARLNAATCATTVLGTGGASLGGLLGRVLGRLRRSQST